MSRDPSRPTKLQPGSWRHHARGVIQRAIAAYLKDDPQLDPVTLFKVIAKDHYPFGQRKHLPYKMWLLELQLAHEDMARARDDGSISPLERRCKACGAAPGRPCKPLGGEKLSDVLAIARDAELEGRIAEASTILLEAYHDVRLASARRVTLDAGPLFGGCQSLAGRACPGTAADADVDAVDTKEMP